MPQHHSDVGMIKHAVPRRNDAKPHRWIEQLPLAGARPWLGSLVTLAIVALAYLVRAIASPLLPPGFPYVTFFPAVIVTSFLFGVRLGSVAALACGLLAWYFFIPPAGSFTLTHGSAFALSFYVLVVTTDLALVHWMQSANRQLAFEREMNRGLADTRELLFRELQHRVSNNLQVAASLLVMQKRLLTDPHGKAALDEAGRRFALIGSISRQLYDPSGAAKPLVSFLDELCRMVLGASGRADVALEIGGDERLHLEPDAAVSTALIVAEAISNALEHGFGGGHSGRIKVRAVQSSTGSLDVSIHNDGHSLPAGFSVDESDSLGLRIAITLARGHHGNFRLESNEGTLAILTLPPHLLANTA